MPLYFFHLRSDIDAIDHEGRDLADEETAHSAALAAAREMICASIEEQGVFNLNHRISVADDEGAEVFSVSFGDAVTLIGQSE